MGTSDTAKETICFFCLNLRFGLADDGPNGWRYRKLWYREPIMGSTGSPRARPSTGFFIGVVWKGRMRPLSQANTTAGIRRTIFR
jgi:hypothetical protein